MTDFLSRYRLPLFLLLAGLVLSVLAAFESLENSQRRYDQQLSRLADRAALSVENKFALQSAVLRGGAALFRASDRVTATDFRRYVERQNLARFNPGILGVGFSVYAQSPGEANRLASAYRQGETFRALWPEGEREGYSIITFLEPGNERNEAALAFDMMSEDNRRAAMERARKSGEVALSHKIELVQEIDEDKQAGFLLYMPVTQPLQGRERFIGWVYSPLRAGDLFSTITDEPLYEDVEIGVYDGPVSAETLLYGERDAAERAFAETRELSIGGQTLTIRVAATRAFHTPDPKIGALVVFCIGLALTLLVVLLTFQQQLARLRIEREVEARTHDLQEANDQLIAEAAARAEAEDQIRQLQKMEAIGQLSGGIAHDFNNMLAIITGNLDMARQIDDPDKQRKALSRAMMGAEKAAELTQRLLAFSRRQTLMPETVDCNRLVGEMSELLRRTLGEQIELKTVMAGDLWPVVADPSQLENAIVNLAVNARDAMPEGGRLTIETGNARLDGSHAAAEDIPAGDFVLIAISDTGTGMSPEVQAKAVDPFFTTKEVGKGTGLGLSQVFGFLKQSDGHFAIYSEEGEGTTIKLYLPRAIGEGLEDRRVSAGESDHLPMAQPGETVLVVEDEAAVRETSVNALEALGYAVIEAKNGEEALERLGSDCGVDLVFTDVVMPQMDGRRLADAVAERCPGMPVLFTTGFTRDAIVHNERLDEGVALLAKPFSLSRLAQAVRERLDGATDQDRAP
ncbi:CHASE domain-containing protein [Sphingomicrobium aestuariivivum]|uniref:CHASE domain-containing protein n=1 Tax=Sphingomicrobium aestuariivivum TaxID=1582356 RepID=UPI001FD6FADB|nr:CHASE domain-containing protein [Sphingomicrobium aestuariivivum]MCJ8190411.1 CHASE domain-containing protein [Sphingomicrobium aestuariivivum]